MAACKSRRLRTLGSGGANNGLVLNGGVLAVTGGAPTVDLTANRTISLQGAGGTITTTTAGTTTVVDGVISGPAGLLVNGAGTTALTGANTYSGTTSLAGSSGNGLTTTLQINGSNSLGDGSATNNIQLGVGVLESTGGTYDLGVNRTITLTQNPSIIADAGTMTVSGNLYGNSKALTIGGAGNIVFSGNVTGLTTLTKTGSGATTLSGTVTSTGTTTIQGGTVQLGNGTTGSLNGTTGSALTINTGGGTFNVNEASGVSQSMGALTFTSGDGTVQSTYNGGNIALNFASLAARGTGGATENFVVTGTNGTNNKITFTTAPTAGFQGTYAYFNGSNYAFYDSTLGYMRGLAYGSDAGAVTTAGGTSIASTTYLQTTGAVTAQANGTAFTTLNLAALPPRRQTTASRWPVERPSW